MSCQATAEEAAAASHVPADGQRPARVGKATQVVEQGSDRREGGWRVRQQWCLLNHPLSGPDPPSWINLELCHLLSWRRSELAQQTLRDLPQSKEANVSLLQEACRG